MVYGPGEHPSKYRSAIINFIHSALKGEKLTVHKGADPFFDRTFALLLKLC
jgi:nucleoside-diphosphate-sugar epimerase